MKKLRLSFIVLFALGICVNNVKAQNWPEFGVRIGANLTSINNNSNDLQKRESPRIRLLGVYAVIPISGSSFSIQPELLYSRKSAEVNNVAVNHSYIQIPVFARVDFATKSLVSPHLLLGPYVSFNMEAEKYPLPPPAGGIPPLDAIMNETVFGLAVGAGIDIKSINIGIRYSHELTNVFDIEYESNFVVTIVAGYQF